MRVAIATLAATAASVGACEHEVARAPAAEVTAEEAPAASTPAAAAIPPTPAVAPTPETHARRTPAPADPATPRETVVTRTTRPGVTVRVWLGRPAGAPRRVVMLLAGGSGRLGLSARGIGPGAKDGLLARTRERFLAAGFVVALVDAPSDRPEGLEGFRSSAEHAADLGAIAAWLRATDPVPLWMIGVSRGSISAANAAARLGPAGPDGLVLLSPVTAGRHERLADVRMEAISVPTLVVSHRGDGCSASPPAGTRALIRRLVRAPGSRALALGPRARAPREADPCDALTRHGYLGIEAELVDQVVAFAKSSR